MTNYSNHHRPSGNGRLPWLLAVVVLAVLFEWRTGFFSEVLRRYQMGPGLSNQEDRGAAQQISLGVSAEPIQLKVVVADVVARVETKNQATASILWGTIPVGQTELRQLRLVNPIVSFELANLAPEKIQSVGTVHRVTVPAPQVTGVYLPVDSVETSEVNKAFFFFGAGEQQVSELGESSDRDAARAALVQFCEQKADKLRQLIEGKNGLEQQLAAYFSRFVPGSSPEQFTVKFVAPADGYFIPPVPELNNFSCPFN